MSQVQIPNSYHCICRARINHLCKSGLDPIDCKSSYWSLWSELFQESILFSTVRHPFERIVSAYQDKIVDYENYKKKLKSFGGVSFFHFVTMILDTGAKNCQEMNRCSLDKHWRPFISRCGYCDVPYNIIVKAETIQEDQKYLGLLANVTFANIGLLMFLTLVPISFMTFQNLM